MSVEKPSQPDRPSDGLMKVSSNVKNESIEVQTTHVKLNTFKLIRILSISLFVFFCIAAYVFQTTDLHDRLNIVRQSLVLQANDPELVRSMRTLALRYASEGLFDKAIETYEQILVKQEAISPNTGEAGMLSEADEANLESLYREHRMYSKLAVMYQERLIKSELKFGPNSPQLIENIEELARIEALLDHRSKAEVLNKRARHIWNMALSKVSRHESIGNSEKSK